MTYPYRGPWTSEVVFVPPDFKIEDCQAASGLNIANCSTDGEFPATAVEREALRVDCGDTQGGMDLAHLKTGLAKRYGLTTRYFQTLDEIETALEGGGWALDINGWLDATPRATWKQNNGNVYHAESFNAGDKPGFCHMANPLAPAGHPGWELPISVALDFARSSTSGRGGIPRGIYALGLPERPRSGPIGGLMPTISNRTPALVDLHVGDELLDASGAHLINVSVAQTQTSPWEEEIGPNHYRLIAVTTGGELVPALIHNTPAANIRPIPAPDCSAQVAAEHERTRAAAIKAVSAI